MRKIKPKVSQEITKIFAALLDEYYRDEEAEGFSDSAINPKQPDTKFDNDRECASVKEFLSSPCSCGKNCKLNFSFGKILKLRKEYRPLSWIEKNAFMLSQLTAFMRASNNARSARQTKPRIRQKFDYHIDINRPVCRVAFLFYYGETSERLKRLQKHRLEVGISSTTHGNVGRLPGHACSKKDKDNIKIFGR